MVTTSVFSSFSSARVTLQGMAAGVPLSGPARVSYRNAALNPETAIGLLLGIHSWRKSTEHHTCNYGRHYGITVSATNKIITVTAIVTTIITTVIPVVLV